jgi:hypothetical protein
LPLVRKLSSLLVAATLLTSAIAPTVVAAAKPIRDVSPRPDAVDYNNGVALPFSQGETHTAKPPLGPAQIGDVRTWLALDDQRGVIYLKNYTLRDVGSHVEVWVANNLRFPSTDQLNPLTQDPTDFYSYDDCRNDGVRNVITADQVDYLIDEFDNNIYPIESDWWSVPPKRDGHRSILPKVLGGGGQIGISSAEYKGEGDNVVVLVDNVRDSNFYDQDNANTEPYIAGFYYSVFDDYFDRTVMSIDAWDWLHRTGATPPHAPTADPCTSAPARPYLYEGVFAHEYQHLLHRYTDPDEPSWVNEGLSDFTEVITGYADLSKHVDEMGYESHTQCYLGWLSVFHADWNPIPRACGPENGLTAWEDQGADEILADYGFAMFFMNYVFNQGFGQDFFHDWQHNAANGIAGLNATLAAYGSGSDFESLFSDQIISALVDGYIDNGASVSGGTAAQFQNGTAGQALAPEATLFSSTEMNGTTGAPPWGADYMDLGSGAGLTSVAFNGDNTFNFAGGPDWVIDGDYFTNPDASGDNYGDNQDLSIAIDASAHVGQVLSFDHYYAMELGWDFGFVQVSTNGGTSWQSLACTGTTSSHDPGAISSIVANVPGYSGPSGDESVTTTIGTAGSPIHVTCPALPAGTDYLAFRLMTDPAVTFDGWHVKNIQMNGSTPAGWGTLANWDNERFFSPLTLDFGFALVGINGSVDGYGDVSAGTSVKVFRPTLSADNDYALSPAEVTDLSGYAHVWAVVWGVPGNEDSTLYQPYSLMVNGAEKADGA